ncbi:phosphotransferase-like protein [Deinococcus navajonensis]|uniref:AAA family ATPase n=1 Tax=Deinococcus navajonensis TaxID=309884 RepID=A0ABV8XQR4_9DEIO
MLQPQHGAASPTPGRLIVINGTSSTGKSTLCTALQALLGEPYMVLGYDVMWMTMPARYFPFQPQEREGVWYELNPGDPTVATGIGFGVVGRQAMTGLHHAVAALLACGLNVIVDVLFFEAALYEEARRLWEPYRPLWVALKPPLAVSERWEANREATRAGRPTGLARLGREEIYAHSGFDLELDPSSGTPEDAARMVIAQLSTSRP